MEKNVLFALDIGTRSIVGLVGKQTATGLELFAYDRQEHPTRSMMDGQIHDVPEVAQILKSVKDRLEKKTGPLKKVAIAAAGRALHTLRATAELDASTRGILSAEDERSLELAAIQAAQQMLAASASIPNPASYYCVGYSVVRFSLDDTQLKSLIGQRGKHAAIELIATFLPRQVIDSLQSALTTAGLEMDTLTLEPIAAINVLIPPTMRHLNLALVDVGAGTSDVAITRNGAVVGYGMVPYAGDEITEVISQQYILDFTVAEGVKRQLSGKNKKLSFTDVLGITHKLSSADILACIMPQVAELAQLIASQIITLNAVAPQAVLLVGGGALTPMLPDALSQALDIPAARVGIRCPDAVQGITKIPAALCTPDLVTPLGILKLAGGRTLNFVNVTVNEQPLRLFNIGSLTAADSLLAAGIDARTLHGRPGLGITVTINGETRFVPGTLGQPGTLAIGGTPVKFDHPLQDGDQVTVTKGRDGLTPVPAVCDLTAIPETLTVSINSEEMEIPPLITVNGQAALPQHNLNDRDMVICRQPSTLGELLHCACMQPQTTASHYTVNGIERSYSVSPSYTINGEQAGLSSPVTNHDAIAIVPPSPPLIGDILGQQTKTDDYLTVQFNGTPCRILIRRFTVTLDGKPASLDRLAPPGSSIDYHAVANTSPLVSDVLLAAKFQPPSFSGGRVTVLLNGKQTEYTAAVKEGDRITVDVEEKS